MSCSGTQYSSYSCKAITHSESDQAQRCLPSLTRVNTHARSTPLRHYTTFKEEFLVEKKIKNSTLVEFLLFFDRNSTFLSRKSTFEVVILLKSRIGRLGRVLKPKSIHLTSKLLSLDDIVKEGDRKRE